MDGVWETLKPALAVSGLGGVSLVLAVWVFRDVIRKSIFPQLTRRHAYQLLTTIVLGTLLLAMSGLGAYVFLETRKSAASVPSARPADPEATIYKSVSDNELEN